MNIIFQIDESALAGLKSGALGIGGALDEATQKIADMLVTASQSNMNWKNPTGALEASMTQQGGSGYREVGSELPYSRRREFGFSGRTDSIGRFYANDPGKPYLGKAIEDNAGQIIQMLTASLDALFP